LNQRSVQARVALASDGYIAPISRVAASPNGRIGVVSAIHNLKPFYL
jgi:hypothetical protein